MTILATGTAGGAANAVKIPSVELIAIEEDGRLIASDIFGRRYELAVPAPAIAPFSRAGLDGQ